MQKLLCKAFGIYPGEGLNAFRFIRLASFWAFGIAIAEILSISLFAKNIGASHLPCAYITTACIMITISCFFIYLLRTQTPSNIFFTILIFSSIFYFITSIFIPFSLGKWFYYILQIATHCFSISLMATFWAVLDHYHTLQEAKRIFGIYNAAYFLGTIFSGVIINQLLHRIGHAGLYAITSAFMILSLLQLKQIIKNVSPIEDDTIDEVFAGGKKKIGSLLHQFAASPYALFLVSMSLIVQILRTCTEFGYMQTLENILHAPNSPLQNIESFLGKCKATIAAVNIILGMFFYRKLIRKIGLANMIMIPPLYFMTVYSEWIIYDSLFVAILAILALELFLFTIEDNNFNLLTNAAPSKLKGAIRIINDSLFEPLGMLFSSICLLLIQANSKILGFSLSILFLLLSIIVRNSYPKSILKNLKQNAIHFERKLIDWMRKMSKKDQKELKQDLVSALSSSDKNQMLAFETLINLDDPSLFPYVWHHSEYLSPSEKVEIIKLLDQSKIAQHAKTTQMIDHWLKNDKSEEIQRWGTLFLAKKGLLHPEKAKDDLDSPDLYRRASAIITLKMSLVNRTLSDAALNRTIASKELDLLLLSEITNEVIMGLQILSLEKTKESTEKALPFLSSPILTIKRQAAKTLAVLADKSIARYAPKFLEELHYCSDHSIRIHCLKALGLIADSSTVKEIILSSIFFRPSEKRLAEEAIIKMGLKTVPILIAIIKDTKLHDRCRILAGKILGMIALPQLRANLQDIIDIEIERAYFYFYYGHMIQKQYPMHDLALLEKALLTGFQSVIDFIIYLLGAAGSIEDCDLIVHTLHHKNVKAKADAIETLEKNCDAKIFLKIYPLIEEAPREEKINYFDRFKKKFPPLTLNNLLDKLQNSTSLFDKTVATHLKARFKVPNWQQSLREQIKTADLPFHQFAYELLDL